MFFTKKLISKSFVCMDDFLLFKYKEKETPKFHNALLLGNSYGETLFTNGKIRKSICWKWNCYCLHFQNTNILTGLRKFL